MTIQNQVLWMERFSWTISAAFLSVVAGIFLFSQVSQAYYRWSFDRDRARSTRDASLGAFRKAPVAGDVIGRLEIPSLDLSTMVLEGADSWILSRAAGHIPGTALPWENGNTAIAGHRDTDFRSLKNISPGDAILVATLAGTYRYRVVKTEVVASDDTQALQQAGRSWLTLVTCYPFHYVGRAPKRFIVSAILESGSN